jgi:integrase
MAIITARLDAKTPDSHRLFRVRSLGISALWSLFYQSLVQAQALSSGRVRSRAMVVQKKTGRPVQFELLEASRGSILIWLERRGGALDEFVFPSRIDHAKHISTRQYARLVDEWVTRIGLRPEDYGTHSLRRTKASIIYKQTGTYVPCKFCSATQRSRAPFSIWSVGSA